MMWALANGEQLLEGGGNVRLALPGDGAADQFDIGRIEATVALPSHQLHLLVQDFGHSELRVYAVCGGGGHGSTVAQC